MKDHISNNKFYRYLSTSGGGSLLFTGIFFAFYLFLFHPGYGINDDLKIISLMAGYPGGNPAPFLVYSNVLVGFFLLPFYSLHTLVNWEVILFVVLNFLSIWSLLYIILSGSSETRPKLFAVMVILACDAYFILNITFTTIASFACLSGICLILSTVRSGMTLQKGRIAGGTALIFVGSLIRFEILVMILSISLPVVLICLNKGQLKQTVIAFIAPCLFISAGYAFNRLYLHFSPDWHTYNIYDKTRVQIDDTHRLENMHTEIRFVGWSGNDQELFAHWFFPDKRIYSLGHLQYLVDNISGIASDKVGTAKDLFQQFISPGLIPYLILIISIWLWMISQRLSIKDSLPFLGIITICAAVNLYLAWAWKIADRTIYSSLSSATIFCIVYVNWVGENKPNSVPPSSKTLALKRLVLFCSIALGLFALGLVLNQSFLSTKDNRNKQAAYQKILIDLESLRKSGMITQNSLIISPAHGLPLEWSNPFVMEFPSIPYFDTGWITFSPSYEQVLQQFDIQSLPDALYQKDNLYLMTRSSFTPFLGKYYLEHENTAVQFQSIYSMPNTFNFPGYDNIQLYKVVKIR